MFDTLSFEKRLTKEHISGVIPISNQELASEAYKLRFSTLEIKPRSFVLKERAFQYVFVELLCRIAKNFQSLTGESESNLKKDWTFFFESHLDSIKSHQTMDVFWHFVVDSQGLSHVLALYSAEKDWPNWRSKLLYIIRETQDPLEIANLLIQFIAKCLVPRLESEFQNEQKDFFQNPSVIHYQNFSLVSKKTEDAFEAPRWIALVAQTIDPFYHVKVVPHISTEVLKDAADRIQSEFMKSHNLAFDHFVRVIQSLSEPSIELTTYDQVQINSFLKKNSPAECSMEQLSDSKYDMNILLSYLEQYGFFIDFKENTSFLYSWLWRPAHQKIIEKVEDWRDRALDQAEDSLLDMVPKMLNKGGAKFIKYLPAIATAAVTILALLGHKKKEHLQKWTAELDEQKAKAIEKNLGLREFVSYHFSSFIVACAKFSIENEQELPNSLRDYEHLLFSQRVRNHYQLIFSPSIDPHRIVQPSWDHIRQSSKLPIQWLKLLTRHLDDPISWAMSQIRLLAFQNQQHEIPVDTKAQLKENLKSLDHQATKYAMNIIDLWKTQTVCRSFRPCLHLPHMTLAHQGMLAEKLSTLLHSHPYFQNAIERSLLKILRSDKHISQDLLPETFSPHSISYQLSQRKIEDWPDYFLKHLDHWEACAKVLTLAQWQDLLKAFKNISSRYHVSFEKLFQQLVLLEERERAWPHADPLLPQKICYLTFPTHYAIQRQDIFFNQLLRDQHYALLDLFVRKLDSIERFDHKSFWISLCNHGQWTLARFWSEKTGLSLSEKELWLFSFQSKMQYDLIQKKSYFLTQGSLQEKKWYFIYAMQHGNTALISHLLKDRDLHDYLSDEKVYFIYQNYLDNLYSKKPYSLKNLKLSLLLFSQLSANFSFEKKRDYIILYMSRAFAKKSPISLVSQIADLADLYGIFHITHSYSRYFFRSSGLDPFQIVMTCLPFIHPQSRTIASQYVHYMASRYDQPHYGRHIVDYLQKARDYWPTKRMKSRRFYNEKIPQYLYEHMQRNRMAWIRWAKNHDCPWLLKAILENKPYSFHSLEITGCWPITAKALLSWMLCNNYADIFKEWICAQAWSQKKWLQITLYAIDRGFHALAIETAQHCECENEQVADLLKEKIQSSKRSTILFSRQQALNNELIDCIEETAQHPSTECVPCFNLGL